MTSGPTLQDYRREGGLDKQRALIVGGGATGQLYGQALANAGVEVVYYLKPRHVADAEDGFDLHPFGLVGRRPSRHFSSFDIVTTPAEARRLRVHQVWFCISAPALRSGIVPALADACPDAVFVCTQPSLDAKTLMTQHIPESRVVMGMTGFVAYESPLPGQKDEPSGLSYYLPPASPSLFSGSRAESVVQLLQAGNLPAAYKRDVQPLARYGSGALIPFVVALETEGWSLRRLKKGKETLSDLCGTITEISAAVEHETGTSPGAVAMLQREWVWKFLLSVARTAAPFDLEAYLEYHFTKLREQSEQMLEGYRELCLREGFATPHLERLAQAWLEHRPRIEEDPYLGGMRIPEPAEAAKLPAPVVDDEDEMMVPPSGSFEGIPKLDAPVVDDVDDDEELATAPTPILSEMETPPLHAALGGHPALAGEVDRLDASDSEGETVDPAEATAELVEEEGEAEEVVVAAVLAEAAQADPVEEVSKTRQVAARSTQDTRPAEALPVRSESPVSKVLADPETRPALPLPPKLSIKRPAGGAPKSKQKAGGGPRDLAIGKILKAAHGDGEDDTMPEREPPEVDAETMPNDFAELREEAAEILAREEGEGEETTRPMPILDDEEEDGDLEEA